MFMHFTSNVYFINNLMETQEKTIIYFNFKEYLAVGLLIKIFNGVFNCSGLMLLTPSTSCHPS